MRIAKAKLIKKITDDGLVEVFDNVPLGKEYEFDIDSITLGTGYNFEKRKHWQRLVIFTPDHQEWFPVELLELSEDVAKQLRENLQ